MVYINHCIMKTAVHVPQIAYYTKSSIKYGLTFRAFKKNCLILKKNKKKSFIQSFERCSFITETNRTRLVLNLWETNKLQPSVWIVLVHSRMILYWQRQTKQGSKYFPLFHLSGKLPVAICLAQWIHGKSSGFRSVYFMPSWILKYSLLIRKWLLSLMNKHQRLPRFISNKLA